MICFINHSKGLFFNNDWSTYKWYHGAIRRRITKTNKSKLFVGGLDSQKCHGREAMKRWVSELINKRASKTPLLRVSARRLGASSSAVFYSRKVDLLTKKNQRGSSANANGLHGGSRNLSLSVLRIAGQVPPLTATCCAWLRLQVAVPVGTSVLPPVVWLIPILHPFSNALLWRVTWAIRAWRDDNTSRVLQVSTFSRPVSHRVF